MTKMERMLVAKFDAYSVAAKPSITEVPDKLSEGTYFRSMSRWSQKYCLMNPSVCQLQQN